MMTRIRLNPLDGMAAVIDDAFRHAGLPGAQCVQVVVLDDRVQPERLVWSVERLAKRHLLATARLHRPWWAWWPRWVVQPDDTISVDVVDGQGEVDPAALAAELLDEPADLRSDPPVKVVLHRDRSGRDAVALRWSHVLTDARGGDLLLRDLGRCYAGDFDGDDAPTPARPPALDVTGPAPLRSRPPGRRDEVFSVMNVGASGRIRVAVTPIDAAESQRVRENAAHVAGFGRTSIFVIAACLRALRRECIRTVRPDAIFRIWWPFGLREGPPPASLPGNEYGGVHLQCSATEAADLATLVARLTRDAIGQLSRGQHRSLWRIARRLRIGFYPAVCLAARWSGRLRRGKRLTTQFRFGGRLLGGDDRWGGIPIAGGFAAAVCPPNHPVTVSLSETAGGVHITVTWLDGAIADETRQRLVEDFRDELLGQGGTANRSRTHTV